MDDHQIEEILDREEKSAGIKIRPANDEALGIKKQAQKETDATTHEKIVILSHISVNTEISVECNLVS